MSRSFDPEVSMRLLILGATGGIGRALVDQALARGHQVTAFVRAPEKLGAPRDGLRAVQGDPRDAHALATALAGHDAVLSALGPPGPGPTRIHRDAARSTVAAMHAAGVRRLLVVSAAVLFPGGGPVVALLRATLLRNIFEDCGEMERIVTASGLNWTIVRPPRLTNGPRTGAYRTAEDRWPRGGASISRADVADCMLAALERGEHTHHVLGMAGAALTASRSSPSMSW
jgi:putative NADH-flavin reductase